MHNHQNTSNSQSTSRSFLSNQFDYLFDDGEDKALVDYLARYIITGVHPITTPALWQDVAIFIRSMVGVDRKHAVRRFAEFISGNELNAEQEDFLNTIIAYVCENGDITKEIVVNESPFDERLSVFTPYMLPLANYIDTIHGVITPRPA